MGLYYYHYYFCNYYYSIIIITVATGNYNKVSKNFGDCAKEVFKSDTSVSIFQRRLQYYLLYGRTKTYKSYESVYNSFLDAQIKGTNIPFNLSPPS